MRQDSSGCRKTSIVIKNGCLALLALLVLHRAKLLASNQSILALGVAPRWVAGTPVPVFTPGTDAGRVCTRALHDAKPTKHTQPFTGKRGFRQGCRNKDTPSFARSKAWCVLKGIGIINQKFISKTDFFCKLKRALPCGKTLLLFYLEYYMQLMQLFALLSGI